MIVSMLVTETLMCENGLKAAVEKLQTEVHKCLEQKFKTTVEVHLVVRPAWIVGKIRFIGVSFEAEGKDPIVCSAAVEVMSLLTTARLRTKAQYRLEVLHMGHLVFQSEVS